MSDEITFTYVVPTETRAGKMPDIEHLVSFAQRCGEDAGRRHAIEFMRAPTHVALRVHLFAQSHVHSSRIVPKS